MNLSFFASPIGYLKHDKDGNKIITVIIDRSQVVDVQKLDYFHSRKSKLRIASTVLIDVEGEIKEITIKSRITFKYFISSNVNLNDVFKVCNDPEKWKVSLYDEQTTISQFPEVTVQGQLGVQ